jgi:aspartate carbamoyltransferase regulatory subunit
VPSPICESGWFLIVSDSGIAHCFDSATGEIAWEERVKEHHASLVSAEGKVWFMNDFGTLRVIKPGATLNLVAESELEEKIFASPALSEGQIFIRGEKTLSCICKRQAPPAAP